jgi:septal ring factor EnvC (AmiA/AmiB activator)
MENSPSGLIELTVHNLREHLQSLEEEKVRVEQKISEVRTNIQRWEAELRTGEHALATTEEGRHQRRKKGENPRILREHFESHPGIALTVQEAAERTGLAHSSVQVVFMKEGSGWKKDADNKWRLIKNENGPLSS